MARLIDANSILDDFLKRYTEMERDGNLVFAACEIKQDFADMISNVPTVDAVPVSELKKLRDYLYAEDLIFMHGLAELNKLIANYSTVRKPDQKGELNEHLTQTRTLPSK